jgi:beta-glucosidase
MVNAYEASPDLEPAALLEQRVNRLLARMTLEEKIGQLNQVDASGGVAVTGLVEGIRAGKIGSIINQVDLETNNALQEIAVEQSRLGIPLLVGRDVIHGFKTVMPLPLAQAASWNPDIVRSCARAAAEEACLSGVNWTFAPMVDICRDPRWGRIAECLGEDPFLAGVLGAAMVEGFQGEDLADPSSIAACAKHFAGYGASESGRDYNTTNIPENELRNVHLPPFKAALDAGVVSFMASFSDIDGIPATANPFLMRQVLRDEWKFDGLAVSDWESIQQLSVHGLTENDRDAAFQAASAGIDVDMVGGVYSAHLPGLCQTGEISLDQIDIMVGNVLRTKFRLGLFETSNRQASSCSKQDPAGALALAREAARQGVVMLKNSGDVLPLARESIQSLAVIGPMADAPYEQLGTWVFDGDPGLSVTPRAAIEAMAGSSLEVHYVAAMENTRSRDTSTFDDAVAAAGRSDAVLLFLGEESILSGEAHCRADIDLPGAQQELIKRLRQAGKPIIAIILAGRPLTLASVIDDLDAILYAWHPGSMAGPAIADLVFGLVSPSGKLPVSFPKMVGQIPVYYGHKNTGRPPTPGSIVHIDDIPTAATQTSFGMTAFHLDAGYEPLYPFGFGLSYGRFDYRNLSLASETIRMGGALLVSVELSNSGAMTADEIVQLYIRDRVGSVTRPVRELKKFERVRLAPGQTEIVAFQLHTDDLAFWRRNGTHGAEPGMFDIWVGGDSNAQLHAEFTVSA